MKFSFVATVCALVACASILSRAQDIHVQDIHVQVAPDFKFSQTDETHFPTIQNALDHAPDAGPGSRLYIHIAPGTYKERIYVSQLRPRTTLVGMGKEPAEVVISSDMAAGPVHGTFFTETMEVLAPDFHLQNVTVENAAGSVGQAVALSIAADRAIVKHCRLLGFQDTLFANYGRQYYVDTYIAGAIDYVFGNAAAVFEHDEFHSTRWGHVTAQSRTTADQKTGYVLLRSRITADVADKKIFLGRPWRAYSHVVVISTELPAELDAKGWGDWGRKTPSFYYGEYGNTGSGAALDGREPWVHHLTAAEAKAYEPAVFLAGEDHWNPAADAALMK